MVSPWDPHDIFGMVSISEDVLGAGRALASSREGSQAKVKLGGSEIKAKRARWYSIEPVSGMSYYQTLHLWDLPLDTLPGMLFS